MGDQGQGAFPVFSIIGHEFHGFARNKKANPYQQVDFPCSSGKLRCRNPRESVQYPDEHTSVADSLEVERIHLPNKIYGLANEYTRSNSPINCRAIWEL